MALPSISSPNPSLAQAIGHGARRDEWMNGDGLGTRLAKVPKEPLPLRLPRVDHLFNAFKETMGPISRVHCSL